METLSNVHVFLAFTLMETFPNLHVFLAITVMEIFPNVHVFLAFAVMEILPNVCLLDIYSDGNPPKFSRFFLAFTVLETLWMLMFSWHLQCWKPSWMLMFSWHLQCWKPSRMLMFSWHLQCWKPSSLVPRPHPLTRRNGVVNQVEFLGLALAFATL